MAAHANQAELNFPTGVAVDNAGNVYIADTENYVVRKLTPVTAEHQYRRRGDGLGIRRLRVGGAGELD